MTQARSGLAGREAWQGAPAGPADLESFLGFRVIEVIRVRERGFPVGRVQKASGRLFVVLQQ